MSEVHQSGGVDCPWPGPIPYTEDDADHFLGRNNEVRRLLDLMERQQLNVLIALSGVGEKFSFAGGISSGSALPPRGKRGSGSCLAN